MPDCFGLAELGGRASGNRARGRQSGSRGQVELLERRSPIASLVEQSRPSRRPHAPGGSRHRRAEAPVLHVDAAAAAAVLALGKARDPAATTAPATCFSPASRIQRAAERPLVAVACAANDLEGGEISRELRGRLTCALITIGCMSRRRTTISFAKETPLHRSIDVIIGSDHLDR